MVGGTQRTKILAIFVAMIGFYVPAFGADDVDYSKFARPERERLSKCFIDMLTVAKRHKLRKDLLYSLEAGCASEMKSIETALSVAPIPGFEGMNKEIMGKFLASSYIGPMEEKAQDLYANEKVSFCIAEACVLDQFRRCIVLLSSQNVDKRTKPAYFESIIKDKCSQAKANARATLLNDFLGA